MLGAGSWGTALALLLARNGFPVWLWGHNPALMERLAKERSNVQYLPGVPFPDNLHTCDSLSGFPAHVRRFLVVVPSHAFRTTMSLLKLDVNISPDSTVVWATKGLEPGSARLLSKVAAEELGDAMKTAVVSGPTFAGEVARDLPTALTVASESGDVAEFVATWFRGNRVRAYTNIDMTGVQIGGALKNVMAISTGISDGLGFGANARAALITRGLAEITRLGVHLGASRETFDGLAGLGDLVLTCTDDQSRNRRLGLGLGAGKNLDAIVAELGQEVEGVNTAREAHQLSKRHQIDMPISEQVYQVLYKHVSPQEAVQNLLNRDPRSE